MATLHPDGDVPLMPLPPLTLPALRQAIATLVPARLPEFFTEMQAAFVRAGEEDSVTPIHMFYRQWGVVIEIERHPNTAARLHAAERAVDDHDPRCGRRRCAKPGTSCGPPTASWPMADWHWRPDPDDLLDDLDDVARHAVEHLAAEITVRDSMVFLDGAAYTGIGPGLRTESRGQLMLTYLTDIRGERVIVVQVTWFG